MKLKQLLRDEFFAGLLTAIFLFSLPVVCAAQEKIAFSSNSEIYSINPDGTGRTLLGGAFLFYRSAPSFSPDANKIAFSGYRTGFFRSIYAMNADGSNTIRLTNSAGNDENPSFGPNGKIAFTSTRDFNAEIYIMNADGTDQMRLTNNPSADVDPTFSRDGSKIAFFTSRTRPDQTTFQGICVINTNGTNEICLDNGTVDFEPSFGPNGKIAFVTPANQGEYSFFICVMNENGTNRVCLPSDNSYNVHPSFNSDGSKIAFQSLASGGGSGGIYVMNADGSNRTQISFNTGDWQPSWGGQSPVIIAPTKLKITGGDILVGSPGQGIILKSPGGATCKLLSIDNAGAMVLTAIACP